MCHFLAHFLCYSAFTVLLDTEGSLSEGLPTPACLCLHGQTETGAAGGKMGCPFTQSSHQRPVSVLTWVHNTHNVHSAGTVSCTHKKTHLCFPWGGRI